MMPVRGIIMYIIILFVTGLVTSAIVMITAVAKPRIIDLEANTAGRKVVLVTYAQNEPFLSSQKRIVESQLNKGSVHSVEVWNLEKIKLAFPQYTEHWNHPGRNGRPSCVFFKPVLMKHVMAESNEGDWIIWSDSSKYFTNGIHGNMSSFVTILDELKLESFPGVALCGLANVDNGCVSIETFRGLKLDTPRYWFAPHFQNNFFAFKKNDVNQKFIEEWVQIMTNLDLACASGVDDQAPFSLLVTKYNLKFLNMCNFEIGLNTPNFQELKNIDFIVEKVLAYDISRVMHTQEDFLMQWRKIGWNPMDCRLGETSGYYSHNQFSLQPSV
jgi:hypothetical protein